MRPAQAHINLAALQANYRLLRHHANSKALAVIKADAYGHGAVPCAKALSAEADGFAVACIEEALALRQAGIDKPILLLEGFFENDELALIDQHKLSTVIASDWQLEALSNYPARQPVHVWLLMDSGMHRLGFAPHDFAHAYHALCQLPHVASVVLMSHMARADETDQDYTCKQYKTFMEASKGLGAPISLSNSASIIGWPHMHNKWARPGLALYGINPLKQPGPCQALQPSMRLISKIIAIRDVVAGEPIGYGGTYVTNKTARVGMVALGYADGYPQMAKHHTPVLVDGQKTGTLGRVSMDMLAVDLTHIHSAHIGSEVEFWGEKLSILEVAEHNHTSAYELLTGIKRVNYVYHHAQTKGKDINCEDQHLR